MELIEIRKRLGDMAGDNPQFYTHIIPGAKQVLGVSVPKLRTLAKEIARNDYQSFLQNNPMDTYEMEMLQAFVIGYAKDDIYTLLGYMEAFIPIIHDWAVNDALCQTFSQAKKHPEETYNFLMKYKDSKKEYEVRVVAVLLMSHFLNDQYIDRVIKVLDELYPEGYYAKMGIAWAVATVMAKYPDKCMDYLKNNHLDDWTYNKAIQKMIESYRVPGEQKEILRGMKRRTKKSRIIVRGER